MQTKYWLVKEEEAFSDGLLNPELREAAAMLAAGKTVAFPTETVYGLGADARSTAAVERIFTAKGRPSDNPLIVHIGHKNQVDELACGISATARRLMERFWPGPLTLVLPVRPETVSPKVTAGLDTVGVRMPSHPLALALIRAAGCPIAAPSANRSGRPSPTEAFHVREDLDGRIDGLVDGGAAGVGLESTVAEVDGDRVIVLRPGAVTLAQLREVAADVALDPSLAPEAPQDAAGDAGAAARSGAAFGTRPQEAAHRTVSAGLPREPAAGAAAPGLPAETPAASAPPAPRSPGMKYTHYAPQGELTVVYGPAPRVSARIRELIAAAIDRGERTGVLAFRERAGGYDAELVLTYGSEHRLEEAAQRLYSALRKFDAHGITYIAAEGCEPEGIGLALMNRLRKAAGGRIERM